MQPQANAGTHRGEVKLPRCFRSSIGEKSCVTQFASNHQSLIEERIDPLSGGYLTALMTGCLTQLGDQSQVFVYGVPVSHHLATNPSVVRFVDHKRPPELMRGYPMLRTRKRDDVGRPTERSRPDGTGSSGRTSGPGSGPLGTPLAVRGDEPPKAWKSAMGGIADDPWTRYPVYLKRFNPARVVR